MPSRVKGIISTRRLLQRVPDEMRGELLRALNTAGPELQAAMIAKAPRGATGRLVGGITWKVYASRLRLVVGFIGKRVNSKLFYARILELGRRAQTVTVTRRKVGVNTGLRRGRKKFEEVAAIYQLRVRARAPQHFVYGPSTSLRIVLGRRLNGIWDRVLRRVANSGNE